MKIKSMGINLISRPWLWKTALAVVLLASFGLRMLNLKNPPLDFAGTRQLFSALKARGIYYQYVTNVPEATRRQAISLGNVGIVEPPVLENIVAQTYRLDRRISVDCPNLFFLLLGDCRAGAFPAHPGICLHQRSHDRDDILPFCAFWGDCQPGFHA